MARLRRSRFIWHKTDHLLARVNTGINFVFHKMWEFLDQLKTLTFLTSILLHGVS
jgi:hypothetical protein